MNLKQPPSQLRVTVMSGNSGQVNAPTMEVDNFRHFFNSHSKTFLFYGVTPISRHRNGSGRKILLAVLATLLTVYWSAIVLIFIVNHHKNDQISIIANWIQMIGNAVALTTTFGTTALKDRQFTRIIEDFLEVDKKLLRMGHRIPYPTHLRNSKLILATFIVCLSLLLSFEFYITVCVHEMFSAWYWVVSVAPLLVYSMGLLQVMFFIHWIKYRCALVNQQLKRLRHYEVPLRKTLLFAKETPAEKDTLVSVTNDLCKLARRINEYFGLFFLSTLTTLFAVTAIQLYYCYVTVYLLGQENTETSVWTLLVPLDLVLVNLSLVVGLTTVCEKVANEGARILQNSMSLNVDETNLSSWMHPMVSQMRFSAFGFFYIDHNMLCSFMAALITYLIIFIQFYTAFGDKEKSTVPKYSIVEEPPAPHQSAPQFSPNGVPPPSMGGLPGAPGANSVSRQSDIIRPPGMSLPEAVTGPSNDFGIGPPPPTYTPPSRVTPPPPPPPPPIPTAVARKLST